MGPASATELPAELSGGVLEGAEAEDERTAITELPLWQPKTWERVREAWQSRHLVPGMARSSIPTYEGRLLGRAWLVLTPVLQVFSFGLLFGGIFHAETPNDVPYLLYLVFGMQAFRIVSLTLMYETKSTKMVRPMARGLALPLLLIPFTALGRVIFHLSFYWAIAAGLLLYYLATSGHLYLQLNSRLLIGVAGVLLCLGYGLAIGLFTSVIYPRTRDIRYMERYALQLWILATPVFYSFHALPHTWQIVAQLNPLTSLIGMVQYGFVDAGVLLPWGILWAVGLLVVLVVTGVWFFNRYATRWIGIQATPQGVDDVDDMF
jgi:homopolymeric O-antigen transport system permease protein